MKRLFVACITIFLGINIIVNAQGEIDALRFSQSTSLGSARSMGLAGGTSAMGADLSAASLNPAGLGLYRRGEMVFTPSFRLVNTDASLLDGQSNTNRGKFGFSNMGLVIHTPVFQGYGSERHQAQSGLISYVYAIGYNQLENYARETNVTGFNPFSSYTDFLAEQANGIFPADLNAFSYAGLAWEAFAIDAQEAPGGGFSDQYFGAANGGNVTQNVRVSERGRRNEWFFAMAANIDDFFYFGGTLGIQAFRYDQTYRLIENDRDDVHNFYVFDPNNPNGFSLEFPFNSFEVREEIGVEGTGINLKLGVLVRPVDQLRIGLSFQSPTLASMTDEFGVRMTHNHNLDVNTFAVVDRDTVTSAPFDYRTGISDYNLRTPYRFNLGLMYLIGKSGFITADLEYLDYGSAKLSSPFVSTDPNFYDYDIENASIREIYRSALNTRFGAEARLGVYRLRAGAAFYGTSFNEVAFTYEDFNNPGSTLSLRPNRRLFTLGAGLRQPNYYIDVAYVNQLIREKVNPYTTSDLFDPTLISSVRSSSLVFTIGFRL